MWPRNKPKRFIYHWKKWFPTYKRQIKSTEKCFWHFVYVFISFQEVKHTSLIKYPQALAQIYEVVGKVCFHISPNIHLYVKTSYINIYGLTSSFLIFVLHYPHFSWKYLTEVNHKAVWCLIFVGWGRAVGLNMV